MDEIIKMTLDEKFIFVFKLTALLFAIFYHKRLIALFRESFGSMDKQELCAMIFAPVMIWMISSYWLSANATDGVRMFLFGVVALIVIYGFGLKKLVNAFLLLRGIDPKALDEQEPPELPQPTGPGKPE